jgi:hypothetical protein
VSNRNIENSICDVVPATFILVFSSLYATTQLEAAYAYGIQRADGSYTRLIRADELSEMNNVPCGQNRRNVLLNRI